MCSGKAECDESSSCLGYEIGDKLYGKVSWTQCKRHPNVTQGTGRNGDVMKCYLKTTKENKNG